AGRSRTPASETAGNEAEPAMTLRKPAVAGRFYPGDASGLAGMVRQLMPSSPGERHLAVMAPHAGHGYFRQGAGTVFAGTLVPRRVVVLAPNHTGRGARGSVWARGAFELPGATIPVDEELAAKWIGEAGGLLQPDQEAHRAEHALEVELPFLHARRPDLIL